MKHSHVILLVLLLVQVTTALATERSQGLKISHGGAAVKKAQAGAQPETLNGWNRARWGMRESEVLVAFGGTARPLGRSEDFDFTKRGEGKYFSSIGIDDFRIVHRHRAPTSLPSNVLMDR